MSTTNALLKPELYSAHDGHAEAGARCFLKGGCCRCGFIFFPMQRYGCEQCGADGEWLESYELRGTGTLVAAAMVHMHKGENRRAPFVVVSVKLDEGPVVRTLLEHSPEQPVPEPGSRVEAFLASSENTAESSSLDLRFRLRTSPTGLGAPE
ncbi:hypothetical protein F6455_07105 [Proteobacteria bacterium 005FR1]|nr:hypothetical protein [Proteobacteria bacterium 005FR1]